MNSWNKKDFLRVYRIGYKWHEFLFTFHGRLRCGALEKADVWGEMNRESSAGKEGIRLMMGEAISAGNDFAWARQSR
jgi:hypothetical protein